MHFHPRKQVTNNTKEPIIETANKKSQNEKKRKRPRNKKATMKTYNIDDLIITDNFSSNYVFEDTANTDFCSTVYTNVNLDNCKNDYKIYNVNSDKLTKYFVVNKTVFLDLEPTMSTDEKYHDYRLYKMMKTEQVADVQKDDDELSEEDLMEVLFVTEEMTKLGLIINSNVYLTHEQWHTITHLDKDLVSCSVCQFQCDNSSVAGHLKSLAHSRKLDGHRPLKKFDLSITRKINENFHCGVCNVIYPIKNYREHESSKEHEGKLLFAINKVSDLEHSSGEKSTQALNNNNIQVPNNVPRNMGTALDRITRSDRNTWPDKNTDFSENTDFARDTESTRVSRDTDFSEPARKTLQETENDCTFRSDSESEHNFNFGNRTFKDIKIYEEDEIEEYIPPIEGVSYASMASKPRMDVPKFLKVDLGTKEFRVKYEAWNMITQIDVNHYYCMVCTKPFLIRFKNPHCLAEEHKKALANCAVVGAFEDYLIRNVSNTLYHCGHCNNLQYKSDMQMHVERYHPIKNSKHVEDDNQIPLKISPIETYKSNEASVSVDRKTYENNEASVSVEQKAKETIMQAKFNIYGVYSFCPFGTEITVSNMGYHALMFVNMKHYCVLCNDNIEGALIEHVHWVNHLQFLNMTPFIRQFQNNLIRAIRGSLHCALCNILTPVSGIDNHNISGLHKAALARALGMVKNEQPRQEIKHQLERPSEFKTELDRFMSTLPSYSRGALSKLQIKNLTGESLQLNDGITSPASSLSSSNGTPTPMSLNNSPVLVKKDTKKKPIDLMINIHPNCYPKEGASAIHSTTQHKNNLTHMPLLKSDSGLPGVTTGSSVNSPPVQLHVTGAQGLTKKPDLGQLPVSLVRRQNMANELLSPREQSLDRRMIFRDKIEPKQAIKNGAVQVGTKKVLERKDTKKRKGKAKEKDEMINTIDSDDEEMLPPFKLDETVLLKLKSSYFKVTNTSFHSLVHVGNGSRFCFVCSNVLEYCGLKKHVDSRQHIENMSKNKFLHNFHGQPFRQIYLLYHCAICNVTMSRKEVKTHLEWSTHIDKYDHSCKKLNKKVLKGAIKSGAKEYSVETQKEFLYVNIPEPAINIVTYIQSSNDHFEETFVEQKLERKSQMIILRDNMMKISFESWHGVLMTKSGTKCIICQLELSDDAVEKHLESKYHRIALGIAFEKQHYPALIRKINENTINCVICNLELTNNDSHVMEHINGRKHEKNYNTIVDKTSHTDSYTDCYKFPISI